MNFASALISMTRGHKIRRKHWKGYWCLDDKKEVIMHCEDGIEINLRNSENIIYTLKNIACDDWEIADDYHSTYELNQNINNAISFDDAVNKFPDITTALYSGRI